MVSTAIVFDHRNRTLRGEEGPVEVRVTSDRKLYYINTGVRVRKREFLAGLIFNRDDAKELNDRISAVCKAVIREVTACIEHNRPVDVSEIRKRIYGGSGGNPESMLEWMRGEVERLALNEATLLHYRLLIKRLEQFGGMKAWHELSVENIYRFDEWLHKLPCRISDARQKMGESGYISDSSVHNYHKSLKALLYRAVQFGVIEVNPYTKLRGKFTAKENMRVNYLTDEEIEDFMSVPLKPGTPVAVARDLFVIQMFTGLSYADMQALDIRDYRNVNGAWISCGERTKTGVAFVSRLLPPVVEVLERYNMKVPIMDNADYNRMLKAIGAVAGIDKRIHSHMGRHTFATWMLSHGATIENVSRMLGHTDITQTQRYAKVLAKSVLSDYDRVAKLFEDSPQTGKGRGRRGR